MSLKKIILFFEKCCLVFGTCLLLTFFVVKIHAYQGSQSAVNDVEQLINAKVFSSTPSYNPSSVENTEITSDQNNAITSDIRTTIETQKAADNTFITKKNNYLNLTEERDYWSAHRKERYRNEEVDSELLGILEIPQIELKVAIFDQATEAHLNKGVARVLAHSPMSGEGNLSIAGHRDSFFRHLGQLVEGDQMRIKDMMGNTFTYQVVKTWIVKPTDTYVLNKTKRSSITLITCYPFYFVGSAPERYILRAERI